MIALLSGVVESIFGNVITLDVNGVGYEVSCSQSAIINAQLGSQLKIVVYTDVKQDSIKLYGFEDQLEKQVFLLLLQVKGIGARTGSEIISRIDKRELLRLIGSGDVARLQAVRGVGKKTAERIIVELRDKVAEYILERQGASALSIEIERINPVDEAIQALQALGFSRRDAENAVEQAKRHEDLSKLQSGEIVREALRFV